jgi:hypothetical protein
VQREAVSAPASAWLSRTRLRRVAWIALFGLGLFLWIPVLLRAKLGASAVTGKSAIAARANSTPALPAPVEIAEGPPSIPPVSPTAGCGAAALTSRLVVTCTILGKTRRAAIVNGRLYREGDKIAAGREFYRLAGVAEDRIELVSLGPGAGVKRSVILQPTPESTCDRSDSH